jgi:hypothetical protein
MKKTLIAMAAVAVAGVASAQVTITGNLAFGFAGDTTSAGASTSGFGTDTANLTFSASEDLGGGLTIKGTASFENFQEDAALAGTGTHIILSGGFGSIDMSSDEAGDYLPIDGLTSYGDGKIADRITYTAPAFGPLTISVTAADDISVIDADVGNTVGKSTTVSLTYTEGPLSVNYTNLDFSGAYTSTSAGRKMAKVSYDAGVASMSYGIIKTDLATDNTQTGLSVTVPMGAMTFTGARSTSKNTGGVTYSGTALTASYALSKRTSIAYYNESFQTSGTSNTKEYSVLVKHAF